MRLLLAFILFSTLSYSQDNTKDSLISLLKGNNDSIKCEALLRLCDVETDENVWPLYNDQLHDLTQKKLKVAKKGTPLYTFYLTYYAASLNNSGYLANRKGNVKKALSEYHESLKIYEQLNSLSDMGILYNNIARIMNMQGDYDNSIAYYKKALAMHEKDKDKKGIAYVYNNIAAVYKNKSDYKTALDYCNKCLVLMEELQNKKGMASIYSNMGTMLSVSGETEKGLDYLNKSLKLKEELNDKTGIALTLSVIGNSYYHINKMDKAIEYGNKALKIAQDLGYPDEIRRATDLLRNSYKKKGDYKKAFDMFELYILMRDSIKNEETKKASLQNQLKYEYEKKAMADSVKAGEEKKVNDAKLASAHAELKSERTQRIALYGGILLVAVFAGFIYNRFKITQKQSHIIRKQKLIVEEQKNLVEEKQKEILDSINYAKRLQEAILPPLSMWKEFLPDSFILYKPKDIVAGDFYWMHEIQNGNQSHLLIAAADCTGHGVPGAMVSVVCSNALNRTVKEFGITEPGKILDKVRELVIETFEKSEQEVKDGMDISLCSLIRNSDRYTEFSWAGANNPLWIIDKNGNLKELKPDKMPIGKYAEEKSFTTHSSEINEGDSLFLFTDGYADQFGGPQGKKYKYKQMQELLLANRNQSMTQHSGILENSFTSWKGELEQIDDVCVIGLRI